MNKKDLLYKRLLTSACAASLLIGNSFTSQAFEEEKPSKPIVAQKSLQEENGQEDKTDAENGKDEKSDEASDKKKDEKTIEEKVKDLDAIDGLFKMYRDPKSGKISMEISADQLEKEFIYISLIQDGVVAGGHFRGQYRQERLLKVKKHFNRLEFVEVNPNFYFAPENPLSRAATANTSESVIHAAKISATTKAADSAAERYLVDVDGLFLSEDLDRVNPPKRPDQKPGTSFSLGKLSSKKSKIDTVNNYPENTTIEASFVYQNPGALVGGGAEVTDPRNVTVKVQHTLIEMPDNAYTPRYDDARVGYFINYVTDLTDLGHTPYKDMIRRWNLVKKDPAAALSEPVEPIVWWIENTTPEELRPWIKDGVESWNIAFEKAGFKNAVVVKIQPDDADWDAGDIRYNVLRWTSSPTPPFGGYGPSFANPRTGQILGSDIMLEYSFLGNRMNSGRIFDTAGLNLTTDTQEAIEAAFDGLHTDGKFCSLGNFMQMNTMLGQTLNTALKGDGGYDERLIKEAVYYLALHEVGHTLGLNHNMKATQARSYETAHDIEAQKDGLVGSVMDYPAINYAPDGKEQAHYYTVQPGPYDVWAIQFGYSPDLDDDSRRAAHLARSNEKSLAFGNDADDMRSPGKGIDPRVNIFDFSDDAVAYARDRFEIDRKAMTKLKDKLVQSGESYQELRNAYLTLTADMAGQGRVTSRYIGGVMVNRSLAGQDGASAPYQPVSEDKQRQAMKVLTDNVFAPDAFGVSEELASHLAIQRRGFAHGGAPEDPKLHGRVLTIQAEILSHILHPNTLLRITDSALYGNSYSVTEMLNDLTDAIFAADSRSSVNSFRQGLQIHYVKSLIEMVDGSVDYVAQSNALANLRNIRNNMARWRGDAETRAHRDHVIFLIDKALETYKS